MKHRNYRFAPVRLVLRHSRTNGKSQTRIHKAQANHKGRNPRSQTAAATAASRLGFGYLDLEFACHLVLDICNFSLPEGKQRPILCASDMSDGLEFHTGAWPFLRWPVTCQTVHQTQYRSEGSRHCAQIHTPHGRHAHGPFVNLPIPQTGGRHIRYHSVQQ